MTDKSSYAQILKSSSIMGGAASIKMIIKAVETKFAAILIGTGGVGLLASFVIIQELMGRIAGLGIGSSAVRDVAKAVADGNQEGIGRAILTLRRMSWLTGFLGMMTMIVISPFVGQLTFNSDQYNTEIAALGLIVLFGNVSAGQTALIQGFRRIGDVARLTIIGVSVTTLLSVSFYYWIGTRGIVPALVFSAAIQLLVSYFFARKIHLPQVKMTWVESFKQAGVMVRLGIAMMWAGLLNSLVVYAAITMISDQFNLQAVGIYSASYALSGMFVNFVLQAMGADYYPRLVGLTNDKKAMNQLVNEQTEVGLLLAVPGILITLVLAPWIIQLFYSQEFYPAVDLLQWFLLGCFGRIITFPSAYILLAVGSPRLWAGVQTSFALVHVIFIWMGITLFGLQGASVAFCLLYLFVIVVITKFSSELTGYQMNFNVKRIVLAFMLVLLVCFFSLKLFDYWGVTLAMLLLALAACLYCLRRLVSLLPLDSQSSVRIRSLPLVGRIV